MSRLPEREAGLMSRSREMTLSHMREMKSR